MAKEQSYCQRREAEVKSRVERDLAEHTIEVIASHGLHRRWRCKKPGANVYWFDIVTWPGCFCIHGDMGTYVFARTADMIEFMRSACMSYGYAMEKCVAYGYEGKEEFVQEIALEYMDEQIADAKEDDEHETAEKLESLLAELRRMDNNQYETHRAMWESGLFDCDMPGCTTYTFHFLWCLHAIKWFCDQTPAYKPSAWNRFWAGTKRLCGMS